MREKSGALEEAVNLSRDVNLRNDVREELAEIEAKIKKLENLKASLFRLEENGRKEIEGEIKKLQLRKKELDGYGKYAQKYKLFSMEVFKLRDRNGWPRIAIFDLNSPICSLRMNCFKRDQSGENYFVSETIPEYGHLPSQVFDLFDDVFEKLSKAEGLKPGLTESITTEFAGVIPDDVRKKIIAANKEFERVFIIAEANWQERLEPNKDPLVIGWDGANCWLVHSFNTTNWEERVKREFTI